MKIVTTKRDKKLNINTVRWGYFDHFFPFLLISDTPWTTNVPKIAAK